MRWWFYLLHQKETVSLLKLVCMSLTFWLYLFIIWYEENDDHMYDGKYDDDDDKGVASSVWQSISK